MRVKFTRKESFMFVKDVFKKMPDSVKITNETKMGRFFTRAWLYCFATFYAFNLYRDLIKNGIELK